MTKFADLVSTGLLAIGDGYRAQNAELGGSGPIFLRSAYLQDSGWSIASPDRLSTPFTSDFGAKVAREGDTVVTTKGNSLGRLGFVDRLIAGAIYSPHLSYWRSLDHRSINPRFLYFWAHSGSAAAQIKARSDATDMAPYLSLRDQLGLEIVLPDIAVQNAIADLLGALDDKIELNHRMAETLEAKSRALFKNWFVDFDPVHSNAEGRATNLTDAIASLFPSRLTEEGLPEGWQKRALSKIVSQYRETIEPALLGDTLVEHYSLPAFDAKRRPSIGPASTIKSLKLSLSAPVILFSKLNPETPRVWTVRSGTIRPMLASTEFLALRPINADIPVSFVEGFLASKPFRDKATGMVTGTSKSHQRVQPSALLATEWPLPSLPVLAAFDNIVSPILERQAMLSDESVSLAAVRDALLPKLISGELRISNAEQAVAAA